MLPLKGITFYLLRNKKIASSFIILEQGRYSNQKITTCCVTESEESRYPSGWFDLWGKGVNGKSTHSWVLDKVEGAKTVGKAEIKLSHVT